MRVMVLLMLLTSLDGWANVPPCGRAEKKYYSLLRCSSDLQRLSQVRTESANGTEAFFQGAEPNVKRSEVKCPTGTPVKSTLGFRQEMAQTQRTVYHLASLKQGGGYVVHNFQIDKNGCIEPSRRDYVNPTTSPTAGAEIPILDILCRPSNEDGVGVISVGRYLKETDANRGRVMSSEMIHRTESIGTPFTTETDVDAKQALTLLTEDITKSLKLLKDSLEGSEESAQELMEIDEAKTVLRDLSIHCQEGLADLKKMPTDTLSPQAITNLEQTLAPVVAFHIRHFSRSGGPKAAQPRPPAPQKETQ